MARSPIFRRFAREKLRGLVQLQDGMRVAVQERQRVFRLQHRLGFGDRPRTGKFYGHKRQRQVLRRLCRRMIGLACRDAAVYRADGLGDGVPGFRRRRSGGKRQRQRPQYGGDRQTHPGQREAARDNAQPGGRAAEDRGSQVQFVADLCAVLQGPVAGVVAFVAKPAASAVGTISGPLFYADRFVLEPVSPSGKFFCSTVTRGTNRLF